MITHLEISDGRLFIVYNGRLFHRNIKAGRWNEIKPPKLISKKKGAGIYKQLDKKQETKKREEEFDNMLKNL